jgi:hypothetical protein
MESSFFYFFSSDPQVLSGVLALFGVFVIFKIQTLKDELLVQANDIFEFIRHFNDKNDTIEGDKRRHITNKLIFKKIQKKNINDLSILLGFEHDDLVRNNDQFKVLYRNYKSIHSIYQKLIADAVGSSIFDAIIIVICLAVIPFEKWIICNPVLLFCSYTVVILSIVILFYKLLSILKKSFS